MNYLSTDEDRKVAAQGLKIVRKIMLETETFKKYEPEEYRPGLHIQDDEELVKAGSDFTQTIFHPVGTCKMGSDENAVVDDRLKVHGIENLRVVDASIMPNITSGNTNSPTLMIAEKASDLIKKDLKRDLALLKTNMKGDPVKFYSGQLKQGDFFQFELVDIKVAEKMRIKQSKSYE